MNYSSRKASHCTTLYLSSLRHLVRDWNSYLPKLIYRDTPYQFSHLRDRDTPYQFSHPEIGIHLTSLVRDRDTPYQFSHLSSEIGTHLTSLVTSEIGIHLTSLVTQR